MTINEQLAAFRHRREMTQKQFADRIGVTTLYVSRIETGIYSKERAEYKIPARYIQLIADAFDQPLLIAIHPNDEPEVKTIIAEPEPEPTPEPEPYYPPEAYPSDDQHIGWY